MATIEQNAFLFKDMLQSSSTNFPHFGRNSSLFYIVHYGVQYMFWNLKFIGESKNIINNTKSSIFLRYICFSDMHHEKNENRFILPIIDYNVPYIILFNVKSKNIIIYPYINIFTFAVLATS